MHMDNKKGMAGVIVAVIILGLLMSMSTSFMRIVQTEAEVINSIDYSNRAMDAAFSGLEYAVAIMQSSKITFNPFEVLKRPYLVKQGDSKPALYSGCVDTVGYTNLVWSDWMYVNHDLDFLETDNGANIPYIFRAISYPVKEATSVNIEAKLFHVKSQGIYRVFDNTGNVEEQYKFQIISLVEVDTITKVLQIKKWRRTEYQNDTDFYSFMTYEKI